MPAAARAELVAAVRGVDYVVLFRDPIGRSAAALRSSRTCTARAPTTPSTPFPSGRPCARTADASRSSAIRRITRRGTCWRDWERTSPGHRRRQDPDCPSGIPRRPRAHAAGRRGVRARIPDAEIDWLVDRPHREFLELVPVISSLVVLGAPRRRRLGRGASRRCARAYDVAIDFQGLLKSAALARLSGAKRVVGIRPRGAARALRRLVLHRAGDVGEGSHVVRKNLATGRGHARRARGRARVSDRRVEFALG